MNLGNEENDKRDACPTLGFFNPLAPVDISRRHLPHWVQTDAIYFVTFRLADSIPGAKLAMWHEERHGWRDRHPEPWTEEETAEYHSLFTERIERWLDEGAGSCILAEAKTSEIVASALRFFDGERYRLLEWVVMPNHVHTLFHLLSERAPSKILHSWKSYTAKEINREIGRTGQLWQHESYDHIVRSESSFSRICEYIRRNPAEAHVNVHHASWL